MNRNEEKEKQEEVLDLTLQQEQFCKYYTQNSELFGNGVLSYALAYNHDLSNADKTRELDEKDNEIKGTSDYDKLYNQCAVGASRLLINDKIIAQIVKFLNEQMTDEVIDARLSEIILHGRDEHSINAIKEYNKLKQRIVEKRDITSDGKPISIHFDEAFKE